MLRLGICLLSVLCCCSQVWAWTGYVLQVEDGNTIKVSKQPQGQGEQVLVRLYGIDAPVLSQPYAREAQYFLHKLLPRDAMINVEETGEEKDGSLTALVQVDGSSVNYQLIVDGLAWVNRTTCKALFCRRWYIQEHRALKQGKGLWGLKLATPPWQWSR